MKLKLDARKIPLALRRSMQAAVEKGAQRLDSRRSRWFAEIDTKKLEMNLGCSCVIGQLYGQYEKNAIARVVGSWVNRLPEHSWRAWNKVAGRYGFFLPRDVEEWADNAEYHDFDAIDRCWQYMERCWDDEITQRLKAAA